MKLNIDCRIGPLLAVDYLLLALEYRLVGGFNVIEATTPSLGAVPTHPYEDASL